MKIKRDLQDHAYQRKCKQEHQPLMNKEGNDGETRVCMKTKNESYRERTEEVERITDTIIDWHSFDSE